MRLCSCLILVACLLAPAARAESPSVPRFEDPDRRGRINPVLAEIDRVYADIAAERHIPGLVYGIVVDDQLVHTGAIGLANVEAQRPATLQTRFRIASMTKSFTALAILKLRDAGRLALQDPVAKYIPEFKNVAPATTDSPPITLLHLLTMGAGFPEDNPWGDRQLAVSINDLKAFVRGGIAMSNAPGVTFEYSNLGFALLGRVVDAVAREPFQRYITREILQPLGMRDTVWDFADVPADQLAQGYRWENNAWQREPMLHDGTYGAMGGLLTTLPDFVRYVAFHLAAWPPRDEADTRIARRATVREMHQPSRISALTADAKNLAGDPAPYVVGYGFGLRWSMDHRNVVNLGHGGGLPGFGSNHRFYPEHGVGVISFTNLTYAPMSATNAKVGAILIEKALMPRRVLPPSAILERRKQEIAQLIQSWDPQLATALAAENFFLDRSREAWASRSQEILQQAGRINSVGPLMPENQLRGTFPLIGEHGRIDVFFTLTPEKTPRLQELRLTFVGTH